MFRLKSIRSIVLMSLSIGIYPSAQSADFIAKSKKTMHKTGAHLKRMAQCTFDPDKYHCSPKEIKNARTWAAGATIAAISAAVIAAGIALGAKQLSDKKGDDTLIDVTYQNAMGGPPFGGFKVEKSILVGISQSNDAALAILKSKITEKLEPGTAILITYKDGSKDVARALLVSPSGNLIMGYY